MAVLSVDLAIRSWSDLGVVLLEQKGALVVCNILRWPEQHSPPVVELAQRLNAVCEERGAGVLMLDGPQAWRNSEPGFAHPTSYERFVGYCLGLYDALGRLGWRRLATQEGSGEPLEKILVESYPDTAWRAMGIDPLPSRRECRVSHLAEAYAALSAQVPLVTSQPPNHGQLQAIVGGLQGLAIENCRVIGAFAAGARTTSQRDTGSAGNAPRAEAFGEPWGLGERVGESWIRSLLPPSPEPESRAGWSGKE